MNNPIIWPEMDAWITRALAEDVGSGDVTTEAIVDPAAGAEMAWVAKSATVVAGLFVARRVFELLDSEVAVTHCHEEGAAVARGETILRLGGSARALLTGERLALNVAQRLSGIAALTRQYVMAVAGTRARIAATRKTTPLLRRLEKYAVTVGGGAPHRFGLDDGVLIKDNHIALAGSIAEAVARVRARGHHLLKIEVEAASLDEVEEALQAGAELVLLDNMPLLEMERAVELARGRALTEASGNVTLETVAGVAATDVDFISVGALTHSVTAADISARMTPAARGR
jgi:nicotinate-nucleotide pyrophosphorylase (carboxylating)